MLAGDAAGGVSRGGRFFVAPPLDRLLLVLFLAKQEKYIILVIDLPKGIPFCNAMNVRYVLFLQRQEKYQKKAT